MGSYENIVKIEEMKRKVEEGDLLSAQKVLDTIEIKKIKNMTELNLIAEVYVENARYEEAAQLYLKLYEKVKSRKALFQLIEVSIKLSNLEDSEYFLRQYQKLAPKDFYNHVFRYKIEKMKGESFEHLIEILEDLKRTEYTEKWAYELAKLYYKAGMEDKCIQECADIELWFGDGTYVEKAKILRAYYSGDSDKNRIMEEIKKRAEALSTQSDNNGAIFKVEADKVEEINPDADFMVHEDVEELAYGLKQDIQNILTDEQEIEKTDQEEYPDIEESKDDEAIAGEVEIDGDEAIADVVESADEEVEKAIYHLLEEDSLNEENKTLKQISDEFQLNLEEVFGNFLEVPSIKKQLVKSLEAMLDNRTKTIMMMITGSEETGKTTLAKDMVLFLYQTGRLKSTKVAKISAEKLNTVDMKEKKETLQDCCLLIGHASELKRKTIESLLELTQDLQENIVVIFEEDKKNMNKLFREYPRLMDLLKNRIHLPQ